VGLSRCSELQRQATVGCRGRIQAGYKACMLRAVMCQSDKHRRVWQPPNPTNAVSALQAPSASSAPPQQQQQQDPYAAPTNAPYPPPQGQPGTGYPPNGQPGTGYPPQGQDTARGAPGGQPAGGYPPQQQQQQGWGAPAAAAAAGAAAGGAAGGAAAYPNPAQGGYPPPQV
jgi:hypothetical protein